MRSRTTLATMEAAAIDGMLASPLMIVWTGAGQGWRIVAVDERDVRPARQCVERPAHGAQRRLPDVDAVDLGGADRADADRRRRQNLKKQLLPPVAVERLRIGEPGRHALEVEHHGGRNDRPRERAPPDLVESGDRAVPAALELAFPGELEERRRHRLIRSCSEWRGLGAVCHLGAPSHARPIEPGEPPTARIRRAAPSPSQACGTGRSAARVGRR